MPAGLLSSSEEHPWARRRHQATYKEKLAICCLRCCFDRTSPNFFLCLILACATIYVVVYLYLSSHVVYDDHFGKVAADLVAKRTDFHEHEIVKRCSPTTKLCYRIVDKPAKDGSNRVHRYFYTEGVGEDAETMVLLKPNNKWDTWEKSDTRFWNVDHSAAGDGYVSALAIAPFVFSSIPLTLPSSGRARPYQVLIIGLGGAKLDMFWHGLRANLNITVVELDDTVAQLAKDWFGVVEDEKRRTVVADGIEIIKEQHRQGAKWDVVVVDACDLSSALPCPAAPFMHRPTLEMVASLLSPEGIVAFNILPHDEKVGKEAISSISSVLPTCYTLAVTDEWNTVLTCTNKKSSNNEALSFFLQKRVSSVSKSLGISNVHIGSNNLNSNKKNM